MPEDPSFDSGSYKFSLFKRSNGYYYVIREDAAGRQKWKSTGKTRRRDALKVLSSIKTLFSTSAPRMSLSSFLREFMEYARANYARRTLIIYEGTLRRFTELVGDPLVSDVTARHFDQYKVHRLESVSAVTVNMELRALRAAFTTAVRWKVLEYNPFSECRPLRVDEMQPEFFRREHFQKLMDAIAEPWLRQVLLFAVLTGMRRGEILNLRWKDVDLDAKLIRIQSGPSFKTKTGRSRIIPLNDILIQILHARRARALHEDYVLQKGGRKINDDHASKKLKQYIRELALPEGLHFHSLRHTFASWLVQDGVSIYDVQKLLGHSSVKVTEIYSHLVPGSLRASVNRIQFEDNEN